MITDSEPWKALADHQRELAKTSLRELFEADPRRAEKFTFETDGLVVDLSKHLVDERSLNHQLLGFDPRRVRAMSDEDLETLRDLAEMAEGELNAVQIATIDDLTKISNRRGFIALAQSSISLCARQRAPVSLVYLDLDKFKPINDNYGHAEGDRALVAFAGLMRKTFRDSDVFARLGGDEFAVLLTNTSEGNACKIVERFRGLLEIFNAQMNRGYDIAFSAGVVSMKPEAGTTIDDLLREADVLMYEKKLGAVPCAEYVREA